MNIIQTRQQQRQQQQQQTKKIYMQYCGAAFAVQIGASARQYICFSGSIRLCQIIPMCVCVYVHARGKANLGLGYIQNLKDSASGSNNGTLQYGMLYEQNRAEQKKNDFALLIQIAMNSWGCNRE